MKQYVCYIKSHCEAPDFEVQVKARNKKEAVDMILRKWLGKYGWEYPEVAENTYEVKRDFYW